MIDVGEWLATRTPVPPQVLFDRIAACVGNRQCENENALAQLFVSEAANLLRSLGDDRTSAFDLLAADALITYALEAAADDHQGIDVIASESMSVIAAVASRGGQA